LRRVYERLPRELLKEVQIIPTRLSKPLDPKRVRIAYIHDLPHDPSVAYLKEGGWNKFHHLVFVSNWQMQQFIGVYGVPWSKCKVIRNGIVPIEDHRKPTDKLRIIYTPTPHRGLAILAGVFEQLCKKYDYIELEVFSSFELYGWGDRDREFEPLYEFLKNHPKINYYGTVANEEVRSAITQCHIFAYPSIWNETSCLCLMEAMSAGLLCVHPNLGALYETAANLTLMYQFQQDSSAHAKLFGHMLDAAIRDIDKPELQSSLGVQKGYAKAFYNIDSTAQQFESLIRGLLNEPRGIQGPTDIFRTENAMPRF
jgi:UDP-glucose:(glucosyl)LPS alpha-1,2-glucosyltransferase